MSGTFGDHGELDPDRGIIVTAVGKKRSGKSIMVLYLFRSYPFDKLVIDVAGDDGPMGPGVLEIHAGDQLPSRWPTHRRQWTDSGKWAPMLLRYVPDPGSDTFVDDMDHMVGLVMDHGKATGHCGLLVHEMGVLAKANSVPPNTRRLLMHNRHSHVTAFFAMPRAMSVDPLVIAQSDIIDVFELPNQDDRKRIASTIGWPLGDFDEAVHELGPHGYLLFDANELKPENPDDDRRLVSMPPLPEDVVNDVQAWAANVPPVRNEDTV